MLAQSISKLAIVYFILVMVPGLQLPAMQVSLYEIISFRYKWIAIDLIYYK